MSTKSFNWWKETGASEKAHSKLFLFTVIWPVDCWRWWSNRVKEKLKKLWITISFTKSNQYSNLRQSKWCPFGTEICRVALKAKKFLSTYVMTSEVKFELYWKTWTMFFLPLPLCENLNLRFMEFSLLMERVYVTAATVLGKTLLPSPACTLQVRLATSRNLCW